MFESSSEARNSSSQCSMTSESCNSFSPVSFDLLPTSPSSPQYLSLKLKPHRSSDSAYSAIRSATFARKAGLTYRDFHLLRRIGAGDIGTVYLCQLANADERCYYAMKVVDKEALAMKKKVQRADTEKKILKMLDHPFLPTLYAEFEASHFSCIVMEYCSGGDLHSLRHNLPRKRFSLTSARFYAAEVLVALQYLHMLGIIYRDLKPENVLVRSDGHIMLSDFDLSLCSDAVPVVESPSPSPSSAQSPDPTSPRNHRSTRPLPRRLSCLFHRLSLFRSKKIQTLTSATNKLSFVAEPVTARSRSFVGTHEYISPEVAAGGSHGNAVDWWSLGIFIYEMVYGHTPFAAPSNEATLRNIVERPLAFPAHSPCSLLEHHARDLISGLLNKEPNGRLGSKRGAADVKTHPFFKGLNFALIRSVPAPEIPGLRRQPTSSFHHPKREKQPTTYDYF